MAEIIMKTDGNEEVTKEVENSETLDSDFSVDADAVEDSTETDGKETDDSIDDDMLVDTSDGIESMDGTENSSENETEYITWGDDTDTSNEEEWSESDEEGVMTLPLEADTQSADEGGKKWTDGYNVKTKPDDNDELMILSTSEKANKRMRFSGVWDWIVDKLASAVVSKLTTTNKTVVGAINELNSKLESSILLYKYSWVQGNININTNEITNEEFAIRLANPITALHGNFIINIDDNYDAYISYYGNGNYIQVKNGEHEAFKNGDVCRQDLSGKSVYFVIAKPDFSNITTDELITARLIIRY